MERRYFNITAFVLALAVLLSVFNTYTIYNSKRLHDKEIEELDEKYLGAVERITDFESALVAITAKLDNLNSTLAELETVSASIKEIRSLLDSRGIEINQLNSKLVELNHSLSDISEDLLEVEFNLSEMEENLNKQLNATPASVYESARNSVVIIRADTKQGSGFIWKEAGYILTNWHVVNETSEITVEFYNGNRAQSEIVGFDAYSDVAVLNVTGGPEETNPLKLGNSSEIWIGQQVVAIGNPLGTSGSLSSGFISQINEKIDLPPLIVPVLQLDVTIAPGSSGGPLLDLHGNVLGITNAGSFYGFNFAVPSNTVKRVAESLLEKGYFRHPLVGFLGTIITPELVEGMNILNVDIYQYGILVMEIIPSYPADEAGIQAARLTVDELGNPAFIAGDIIISVDGITIRNWSDWDVYFAEKVSPDQTLKLIVWRDGETREVELTTTEREPYGE